MLHLSHARRLFVTPRRFMQSATEAKLRNTSSTKNVAAAKPSSSVPRFPPTPQPNITAAFYENLAATSIGMDADIVQKLQPHGLSVDLMPFQQEGVAWMVRRELTTTGGVMTDHLGMGKTIQMISLCLANPLQLLSMDQRFAMQIIESAGSLSASRIERMTTVCRLLQKLNGVGTCSRLNHPGIDLLELRVKFSEIASKAKLIDVESEDRCAAMLEPWLRLTRRLYPHYEAKCRLFISTRSSVTAPNSVDSNELRTLIVAPAAILMQWKGEITKKVQEERGIRTHLYHGDGVRITPEELETFDFVLTTYDTLAMCVRLGMGSLKEQGSLEYSDTKHEHMTHSVDDEIPRGRCGPAFNIHWKRVILDEAHIIRHRTTLRWLAVKHLMANKKWCVTATPLHNSIHDIQPLLSFIEAPELPISGKLDSNMFLSDVVLQRSVARSLKDSFLRREPVQKSSTGQIVELVRLPLKTDEVVFCTLDAKETLMYNALVSRYQNAISKVEASKSNASVFAMLCRLRQLCCHSWLLDGVDLSLQEHQCSMCNGLAEKPLTAPCGHIFCRACVFDKFVTLAEASGCDDDTSLVNSEEPSIANSEDSLARIHCPVEKCGTVIPKTILTGRHPNFRASERKNAFSMKPYETSTKVDMLLKTLNEIHAAYPEDKIVVFTHFVTFIDVLEVVLERNMMPFLRLDGSMSIMERAGVVKTFEDDHKSWILLASKLATGVGLNLTMANHVIVLDPWWNPAIEEQAVHRCHRIGQTKPVFVKRFIVAQSVEQMCYEISPKKKELGDLVLRSAMAGDVASSKKSSPRKKSKEEVCGSENPDKTPENVMRTYILSQLRHLV